MGTKADMEAEVSKIFRDTWTRRDGRVVPSPADISLGNHGVDLNAVILYADLRASTNLVDKKTDTFAAEVYKTFLACATRMIKYHGGVITSYDGDRVMGVFIGDSKNTSAAKAALRINWAVREIVQVQLKKAYAASDYTVTHTVGVDASTIMAARTGVRGDNDIVWVGRAANHAAKLTELKEFPSYITSEVFNAMADEAKYANGVGMWNARTWTDQGSRTIYGSGYTWSLD